MVELAEMEQLERLCDAQCATDYAAGVSLGEFARSALTGDVNVSGSSDLSSSGSTRISMTLSEAQEMIAAGVLSELERLRGTHRSTDSAALVSPPTVPSPAPASLKIHRCSRPPHHQNCTVPRQMGARVCCLLKLLDLLDHCCQSLAEQVLERAVWLLLFPGLSHFAGSRGLAAGALVGGLSRSATVGTYFH